MLQIAAEFSKLNPDIRVNVQFMIGNSVEENIKPRIASGNLPDLVSVNPNAYAAELADQGILADVGGTSAWNNMLDPLKGDWTSRRSRRFGISGGVATTLIYYNQDMFAKAGIKELPTNFPEFLKVCDKLKRAGFTPIMWNGGFPNMLGNGPFSFGFANNVVAREPDWKNKISDGTLDLNTPQVADIFAKILLIADRGYVQEGFMATDYDRRHTSVQGRQSCDGFSRQLGSRPFAARQPLRGWRVYSALERAWQAGGAGDWQRNRVCGV